MSLPAPTSRTPWRQPVRWAPLLTGAPAVLLGVISIIGWQLQLTQLVSFGLDLAPMQYDTAVVITAAGIALILTRARWRWPVTLLAAAVGLLGLVTLITYALALELGYDPLMIGRTVGSLLGGPQRMSPTTAATITLVGAALILTTLRRFPLRAAALVLLGTIVLGVGLYSLLGYLGQIQAAFGWSRFTHMSMPAAGAIAILGLGLLTIGWDVEQEQDAEQISLNILRRSIVFYTVGAVILIVLFSAALVVIPVYEQLRNSQNARLREIALVRSGAIAQYVLRAETMARQVTSRSAIRHLLERYNRGELSRDQLARQTAPALRDAAVYSDELVGITRLDRTGKALVAVGPAIPTRLWPKPAPAPGRITLAGPDKINGVYYMIVRVTIRSPGNTQILGWDILLIGTESVQRILADRSDLGRTGHVALARLHDRHAELFQLKNGVNTMYVTQAVPPIAGLARESLSVIKLEEQPPGPGKNLSVVGPVDHTNLAVVVTMSRAELYARVDRQLLVTTLGVVLLALLGALGMLLVVRPLTGGIVLKAGTLERKVAQATDALQHELAERKRYELALQESEQRFNLAVNGSDAGIWDWDLRTNNVYFSPRWKSMIGYQDHEIRNHFDEWAKRIHPDDYDRAMKTLEDYQKGRSELYELEHRLRHKDGSYRWILARGVAVRDEHGLPYRMAGSHIDITERKRGEQQLAETARALERSNRELEQFACIASHDLQEPLRKVISFGEMLANRLGAGLDDQSRDFLDRMHNATHRMQALIEGLLQYSRVASAPQAFEQVDLKQIVADVVDDLQVHIEKTAGRIEVGDLPVITASPLQMRQLFQNLISNALKFHRPDVPPLVRISANILQPPDPTSPGRCRIIVKDNGIGFEPRYAQKIFTPFQRLHNRTAYKGTGIGLSLCRKIVERHGGDITAASQPDQGSSFIITVPMSHPTGAPP